MYNTKDIQAPPTSKFYSNDHKINRKNYNVWHQGYTSTTTYKEEGKPLKK